MYNDPQIGELDGNNWERICHTTLKQRYKEEYFEVPDSDGDYGIDGLVRNECKVYQCYCPEKDYDDKALYQHLQQKVNKDLNKLRDNETKIKKLLDGRKITKWVLVSPQKPPKKEFFEYLSKKKADVLSWKLEIVHEDFELFIIDRDHLLPELLNTLQSWGLMMSANNRAGKWAYPAPKISPEDIAEFKANKGKTPLIENAHRKQSSRLKWKEEGPDKDQKVLLGVENYIRSYLIGESIKSNWEKQFPDQLEHYYKVKSSLERKVEQLCDAPQANGVDRYSDVLKLAEDCVNENFGMLSWDTRQNISQHIVAEWIINCPLSFD